MIEYDASTQESLKRILSPIRLAVKYHRFALYFVECSLSIQQNQYIAHLAQQCDKFDIILLQLDLSSIIVENLRQTALDFLHEKFLEQIPDNIALIITGLESSILLDSDEEHPAVLQIMNFGRDNYPKSFPHPFIICLSDKMLQKVQKVAPDFWSWRRAEPLRFAVTEGFLEQEITKALSFNQMGSWNDAVMQVSIFERVLETYSELYNNTDTELELLSRLGDAYRFLEKYQKAYNCYLKALRIAENLENSEKRATILNKLGIAMRETKDLDKALEFFQGPLKFAEERGDLIGQGVALNNIGLIYLDKGEFSDAVKTLEHALTINETSNNLQVLSNTQGNLGLAHYKQGTIGSAIEYYHRSLEISSKIDDQGSYWKDLLNLGLAYSEIGEFETAFKYYSDAADVSRRAGDLIGEKRCFIHLAQFASLMEGYNPIVFYEEALEIARKIKDNEDEYNILTALASTYRWYSVRQERAISYYEEAEKKAQELGDSDRELSCLISIIQLHGRGDPDSVAKYKERTKLILTGTETLKTKMLNAWLVNDRDQIPSILKKEKQYILCLSIGSFPSLRIRSEVEAPSYPIANVEFIYNLAAKRDFRSPEFKGIAKPTETPRPTTTEKLDVSAAVQPSDRSKIPTNVSDEKPELADDEHELQRSESNGLQPTAEKLSEKLIGSLDSEALIDIEVNIEGIGFDVEKSSDTLKTSWEHGSDLLVFPVTPRELGKKELDIKCNANRIPFDFMLSVKVEESLKSEDYDIIKYPGQIIENLERPFLAILGGKTFSDKIGIINSLMEEADAIIIGGEITFTFLKAEGKPIGDSIFDDDKLDVARDILIKSLLEKIPIYLPISHVIVDRLAEDANMKVIKRGRIPNGWQAVDIGPDSVEKFKSVIEQAKTIVWNGPLGVFEFDRFARGTTAIAQSIANSSAKTFISGSDTIAAVKKAGITGKVTYIPTGGGQHLSLFFIIDQKNRASVSERITAADGAEMVLIPAGEFQMGSNDGEGDEKPAHTVYLNAFYIDVYPVTNAQYRKFIEATKYPEPQYWNDKEFNQPNQPVVGVSWYDAMAYAEWAGKRLPTEAEWEKAARGGLVGKKYPWGDEVPDDKRANFYPSHVRKTTPVGSYLPNGYGLYDMAGNVREWCLDEYQRAFYKRSPKNNPLAGGNLSELLANYKKTARVLRGGSWVDNSYGIRVACRGRTRYPGDRDGNRGFRCSSRRFP